MTEIEKSRKDALKAGTSLVLMAILHVFFPFFASLGYAIQLEYWKPFWVATFAAIASTFVAVMISGILGLLIGSAGGSPDAAGFVGLLVGIPFGLIPPVVSFLMFRARVLALRSREDLV